MGLIAHQFWTICIADAPAGENGFHTLGAKRAKALYAPAKSRCNVVKGYFHIIFKNGSQEVLCNRPADGFFKFIGKNLDIIEAERKACGCLVTAPLFKPFVALADGFVKVIARHTTP